MSEKNKICLIVMIAKDKKVFGFSFSSCSVRTQRAGLPKHTARAGSEVFGRGPGHQR